MMPSGNFLPNRDLADFQKAHHLFSVFLGRSPQSIHEAEFYAQKSVSDAIYSIVAGEEFFKEIMSPVMLIGFTSSDRFQGEPTWRLIRWLQNNIPLQVGTKSEIETSQNWRSLIGLLWRDPVFNEIVQEAGANNIGISSLGNLIGEGTGRPLSLAGQGYTQIIKHKAAYIDTGLLRFAEQSGDKVDLLKNVRKLTGLKETKNGYDSFQPDSQMLLNFKIQPGIYKFSLRGAFEHENGAPVGADRAQLFFDFGSGYSEESSFVFPTRGGRLNASGVMQFKASPLKIRFDPTDIICHFKLNNFELKKMDSIQYLDGGL